MQAKFIFSEVVDWRGHGADQGAPQPGGWNRSYEMVDTHSTTQADPIKTHFADMGAEEIWWLVVFSIQEPQPAKKVAGYTSDEPYPVVQMRRAKQCMSTGGEIIGDRFAPTR